MKKICSKILRSFVLLSSSTLLSVLPVISTQAQIAPGLKVRYKTMYLSQRQCINRAVSLLQGAGSTNNVRIYDYVVGAYSGTTTVTITCIANNQIVIFNAAGVDGDNIIEWVNWMANNF